jgi:hypothetical protein
VPTLSGIFLILSRKQHGVEKSEALIFIFLAGNCNPSHVSLSRSRLPYYSAHVPFPPPSFLSPYVKINLLLQSLPSTRKQHVSGCLRFEGIPPSSWSVLVLTRF